MTHFVVHLMKKTGQNKCCSKNEEPAAMHIRKRDLKWSCEFLSFMRIAICLSPINTNSLLCFRKRCSTHLLRGHHNCWAIAHIEAGSTLIKLAVGLSSCH
jgi:hypothetical protein